MSKLFAKVISWQQKFAASKDRVNHLGTAFQGKVWLHRLYMMAAVEWDHKNS